MRRFRLECWLFPPATARQTNLLPPTATMPDIRLQRPRLDTCGRGLSFGSLMLMVAGLLLAGYVRADDEREVRFARDIQPILVERCLLCHGPDDAEAGLRLDSMEAAHGELPSGTQAVVPGDAGASELIRRLETDDEFVRMPPDGDPLSEEEIALLRRWINEGGRFDAHWAFQPVQLPEVPWVSDPAWCAATVDHFVLAELDAAGIEPSPQADRYTLVKRLYFDLLGLPPSPAEVDAFVQDTRPDAYERLVNRLLDSRHFGERWGRHWLDMARYADSDGYEKDRPRPNAWRYRDWVIEAINRDLPLDRFAIEQLAGDLLAGASPVQHLATAFHRQTLTNTEGGVDQEEFRVEATFDRTETTAGVWMGLTMNCARCHSHKYDPISHSDYYRLFAMFNSAGETEIEIPRSEPELWLYQQAKAEHDAAVEALEAEYAAALEQLRPEIDAWQRQLAEAQEAAVSPPAFHSPASVKATADSEATLKQLDDGSLLVEGPVADKDRYTLVVSAPPQPLSGLRIEVMPDPSLGKNEGPGRAPNGNFVLTGVTVEVSEDADFDHARQVELTSAEADFSQQKFPPKNALDPGARGGWAISPEMGKPHTLTLYAAEPVDVEPGGWLRIVLDQQYGGSHTLGRFAVQTMTGVDPWRALPSEVIDVLKQDPEQRQADDQRVIDNHVARQHGPTAKLLQRLQELREQTPPSPMMQAAVIKPQSRPTQRLERGDFLQPAEEVESGAITVIEQVHPLRSRHDDQPPDRLDLALWLVDPEHPLTARVIVNQVWARLFGQGIVPTVGDFGVRGERPTHPELLDWLAWKLPRDLGWSRKRLIKSIVISSTYRQASRHRPELQPVDPTNRLLARQNRVRVEAEVVRDLALAAGGLLDRTVGGPSVFPPLPPGVAELSYANNFKWKTSDGGDRYRRGMYTFFKRTAPHPTLITFDCPDANTTQIQREASNTPLQALALLNNEVFTEASLALAGRLLTTQLDGTAGAPHRSAEAPQQDEDTRRLLHALRLSLVRPPSGAELAAFAELLAESRQHYQGHPDDTEQFVALRPDDRFEPAEYAAWAATVRMMLNLDEFIVRD